MLGKVIFSLFTAYPLLSGCSTCYKSDDASFPPIVIPSVSQQDISVPDPVESSILNVSVQSLQEMLFANSQNSPSNSCTLQYPHTIKTKHSNTNVCQQRTRYYHYDTTYIIDLLYASVVSCIALYLCLGLHHHHRSSTHLNVSHCVPPESNQKRFINNIQIILDYDDTIFPTDYTHNNIENDCIEQSEWTQLRELNAIVHHSLLMWIELFGAHNICIVSNAKLSWVDESCCMYNGLYQNIRNLVMLHQIQVISATDSYRSQKSTAFMAVLRKKHNINKVICIGDSEQEYDGIDTVCSVLKSRRRRGRNGSMNYCRFKLSDRPSLETMIHQLKSLRRLDYDMISKHHFDESYVI